MNALFFGIDHREHAIVRRHKVIAVTGSDNGTACSTHSRIDHDHVNRPRRKIGISLRYRERAIEHIERLNRVRNIDNRRFRHDVQNDALHGADKMIVGPKISRERNNWTMRQLDPSLEDRILPVSAKLIPAGVGRQGTSVIECDRKSK